MSQNTRIGTQFRIATSTAWETALDGGYIHFYGNGSIPTSPDLAPNGTLIATAGPIAWDVNASGQLVLDASNPTVDFVGLAAAGTGVTAQWYRMTGSTEATPGGADATKFRMDGVCGAGAAVVLSNYTIVHNVTNTIQSATVQLVPNV